MSPRLGVLHFIILFGGVLLLLAVSSFLSFLWFGDSRSAILRAILLDGWLIRTVTILSLTIRATAATQLANCVSMIAALTLEHGQSPLPNTAAISMMRFQNSGPLGLLFRLWPARTSVWGLGLVVSTTILAITSICLQFTSTALLSDVSSGYVRIRNGETSVLYTQSNNHLLQPNMNKSTILASARSTMSGHHLYSSPIFPVFAEYTENPFNTTDGVVDTGLAMRAFIPIGTQNDRVLLRGYSGPATVFDVRVACMRPDPSKTNFRFYSYASGDHKPYFSGRTTSSSTVTRFNGTAGVRVNCSFAVPKFDRGEWPVSLCIPSSVDDNTFGLVSVMEPWPPTVKPQTPRGFARRDAYLLINTTGTVTGWEAFLQKQYELSTPEPWRFLELQPAGGENEWLHLKSTNISSVGFSISICHSSMDHINAVISATTTAHNISEPAVSWIAANESFITNDVRRQMGSTGASMTPSDRGIFNLSPLDSWLGYDPRGKYIRDDALKPRDLSVNLDVFIPNSDRTVVLCSTCECPMCQLNTNVTYLHAAQAAVFNDILQTTRNAAKAVQALVTMMSAKIYYDQLEFFSVSGPANMSSDVPVLRPVSATFFTVAMVMISLHIMVALATTAAFLVATRHTLLGNAWHVISQFRGQEIEAWCKDQLAGDVKLRKIMNAQGESYRFVALEKSDGRIQMTVGEPRRRVRFNAGGQGLPDSDSSICRT